MSAGEHSRPRPGRLLRELVELDDPRVRELMQRWGLYYRARPIESEEEQS